MRRSERCKLVKVFGLRTGRMVVRVAYKSWALWSTPPHSVSRRGGSGMKLYFLNIIGTRGLEGLFVLFRVTLSSGPNYAKLSWRNTKECWMWNVEERKGQLMFTPRLPEKWSRDNDKSATLASYWAIMQKLTRHYNVQVFTKTFRWMGIKGFLPKYFISRTKNVVIQQ